MFSFLKRNSYRRHIQCTGAMCLSVYMLCKSNNVTCCGTVCLMWRRKLSGVERIRGRKWVSLFASLSYSFQADRVRPHHRVACSWSHMISRGITKHSAPSAPTGSYIYLINLTQKNTLSTSSKEKDFKQVIRIQFVDEFEQRNYDVGVFHLCVDYFSYDW